MSNPFQAFAFNKGAAGPSGPAAPATAPSSSKQLLHASQSTSSSHRGALLPTQQQQLQLSQHSQPAQSKRVTRRTSEASRRHPTPTTSSPPDGSTAVAYAGADADADAEPSPSESRSSIPADNAASNGGGPAAAAAAAPPSRKRRQAYTSLSGPPKGLGPKLGSAPLRLILIGHNPSDHAYHTGHYYSNPSNRMWSILISTGIAPPGTTGPEADDIMPAAVGVGFTDVGSGQPGTDSSKFTSEDFQHWRSSFYDRLVGHMQAASASIGCTCGQCGAPALVAFAGKRQYLELMNLTASGQMLRGKSKVSSAAVQLGRQPPDKLPPGWPLPVDRTEVWVLTSTSGAAPMSNEDRQRPYKMLAERLAQLPWPQHDIKLSCCTE